MFKFPYDPLKELEDFSKLGLGAYSAPPLERWFARWAFFSATRKVAPEALQQLRDECLPLFDKAKRRDSDSQNLPFKISWPAISIDTITPKGWSRQALFVNNWDNLCLAAAHDRLLRELRDRLQNWCQRHHLADRWLVDSALANLSGWSDDERERNMLRWGYPSGCVFALRSDEQPGFTGSVSGEGLPTFRYVVHRPSAPPVYDPGTQTWQQYMDRLDVYRREQEAAFARAGFHPRKPKRRRTGLPSMHFEWLVRYQVQEWSPEQIAEEYDYGGHGLDRVSVGEALRKLATLIELTLRPPRRGRPRKAS